jgi:hypothetical protein
MSMNESNNFETRRADTVPDGQQKSRVAPWSPNNKSPTEANGGNREVKGSARASHAVRDASSRMLAKQMFAAGRVERQPRKHSGPRSPFILPEMKVRRLLARPADQRPCTPDLI